MPEFSSGRGPIGVGLAPGQTDHWVTEVPLGLTSFWTAQPLSALDVPMAVEVTNFYHESPTTGVIQRHIIVFNRGQNPAIYILLWVQTQT